MCHRANLAWPRHVLASPQILVSRTLMRTVMETYGWSIKFFLDLKELVAITRDGIQGKLIRIYFRRNLRY